jgi:hypothetical protein
MMAACVGVRLSLLSQPATFTDPDLSRRVRDAVLSELLINRAAPKNLKRTLRTVALQLVALVSSVPTPLTGPETGLLLQWLETISLTTGANASHASAGGEALTVVQPQRRQRRDRG